MSLDRTTQWSILIQRQMGARPVVIIGIRGQDPTQMPRAEDDNVIQAVLPKRSDYAFRIWVLPRRSRHRNDYDSFQGRAGAGERTGLVGAAGSAGSSATFAVRSQGSRRWRRRSRQRCLARARSAPSSNASAAHEHD